MAISLHLSANIFLFGDFNAQNARWLKHSVTDPTEIQTLNFSITHTNGGLPYAFPQ